MRKIDRLDVYMRYKGLNDNQVTNQLGLSNGVIGKSRKEGRDISHRVLELFENYYTDLNIDWVITGSGEMLKKNNNTNEEHGAGGFFISDESMRLSLNQSETIRSQQETIRVLTDMIDRLTGGTH